MSLDADTLADRRRLKRRLFLWRAGAVIAVLVAVVVVLAEGGLSFNRTHIARVTIGGVIVDDRYQQDMLERIGEDDSVKAVILSNRQPGWHHDGRRSPV